MKKYKIIFYSALLVLIIFAIFTANKNGNLIGGIIFSFWLSLLVKGAFYFLEKNEENRYIPHTPSQHSEKISSKTESNYNEEEKESNKNKSDYKESKCEQESDEYLYSILGINRNSSIEEIKKAYKEEISKYHPDKVEHLGFEFKEIAERKSKDINNAYNHLKKKFNF